MAKYQILTNSNIIRTQGEILDQGYKILIPEDPAGSLGRYLDNGEIFELPAGTYYYRFSSYGDAGPTDFSLKVVNIDTDKTVAGPKAHKSPQLHDIFKFTL
jgi:hypothetical protein